MTVVRTIDGDVSPSALGVVDAHDHLIRVGAGEVYLEADHQLDSVEKAVEEAGYLVSAATSWADAATVVDMCPINCGRDIVKLAEVSAQLGGLHVIAATGFHQQKMYLEIQSHWVSKYDVDQIAELLIADIELGIDQHDYAGPLVERSVHRAGVIKVATSYGMITPFERKCMRAAAIAAIETGVPINTHTTAGTCGYEQAAELINYGVEPDRIAIGHIQRNADVYYLRTILDQGVYLELDGTNRLKYQPDSNRIMVIRELGLLGYGDRLLLGTDSGKRSYQKAYGAVSGIDYNVTVDAPRMLAEGFEPSYVRDLLCTNGQRFFQMRVNVQGQRL